MTTEQTEALVNTVLYGPTIDRASAFFDLIKAVADPQGNTERFGIAEDALCAIAPHTKEYEAWLQKRIAVKAAPRPKRKVVQQ